jgi:hypothetical protein
MNVPCYLQFTGAEVAYMNLFLLFTILLVHNHFRIKEGVLSDGVDAREFYRTGSKAVEHS